MIRIKRSTRELLEFLAQFHVVTKDQVIQLLYANSKYPNDLALAMLRKLVKQGVLQRHSKFGRRDRDVIYTLTLCNVSFDKVDTLLQLGDRYLALRNEMPLPSAHEFSVSDPSVQEAFERLHDLCTDCGGRNEREIHCATCLVHVSTLACRVEHMEKTAKEWNL